MRGQQLKPSLDSLILCHALSLAQSATLCYVYSLTSPKQWLSITGPDGRPRLDDPADWVRLEIAAALVRGVRVIPVLVQEATMPGPQDLPEKLAGMSRRQALPLDNRTRAVGLERLAQVIERTMAATTTIAVSPRASDIGTRVRSGSDAPTQSMTDAAIISDNVDQLQLLRTLKGHTGWAQDVAFAPDGQTLASSSDDGTVRLWRVADGQPLRTLEGHTTWVMSVAFAPDGQTLASTGDRTVQLWGVPRPAQAISDHVPEDRPARQWRG
jgi:WD domain, G-beta repeat